MIHFLISFASLFIAVNLPFLPGVTTKRFGFIILILVLFHKVIMRVKLRVNQTMPEIGGFWLLFLISSLFGVFLNQEFSSTGFAIFFTFVNLLLLKVLLDSTGYLKQDKISMGWLVASCSLTCLFILQIFSIIDYEVSKILSLRKLLLEDGFSVNSTFNQVFILLFCNIFYLVVFAKHNVVRVLLYVLTVLLTLLVFLSLSRQNILACLTLFVLIFITFTSKRLKVTFICVLSPILLFFVVPEIDQDSLSDVSVRIDKTVKQVTSADYARFRQFSDSIQMGTESPFIGVGLGGYYLAAKKLGYSEEIRVPEAAVNQLVAEHGIIMLLFFLGTYLLMYLRIDKAPGYSLIHLNSKKILKCFLLSFGILLFFNEIHAQASLWVLYLLIMHIINQKPEYFINGIYPRPK